MEEREQLLGRMGELLREASALVQEFRKLIGEYDRLKRQLNEVPPLRDSTSKYLR